MVKVVELKGKIDFLNPEAVFTFVYGDDQFIRRYHKKVNKDPYAEVTSWTENCTREVKFSAPFEAPKLIKKIIAADTVNVKEVQKYRRVEDHFAVTSKASLDIPGGDCFITSVDTILSPDDRGGCDVNVTIALDCKAGVWGLQGAVESFMESQAKASFEGWMMMAHQFCQEKMGLGKAFLSEVEDQDEFFDAELDGISSVEESELGRGSNGHFNRLLNMVRSPRTRNGENATELQSCLIQTVLRELTYLQISTDASRNYLEKLNAKFLKMEDDLIILRSHMEKTAGFGPEGTALCLYGLGLATGLAIGFIYLKAWKQS